MAEEEVKEYDFLMRYIEENEQDIGEAIGRFFCDSYSPRSIIDVGCGPGIYTAPLQDQVEVLGIDNYRDAGRLLRKENFILGGIEDYQPTKRYDLALCIEVAEHIPFELSSILVSKLADCSDRIVFSSAPPGQGGVHHINCQPQVFWDDLFTQAQYCIDDAETKRFKDHLGANWDMFYRVPWIRDNVRIYRRTT